MNTLLKKVFIGTLVAIYLMLGGISGQVIKADDTEVYFYQGDLIKTGLPQIVLTLDVTSSMNGKGGGDTTRLQMVREALLTIPDAILYKEDEDGNQVEIGPVKDHAELALVAFHKDNVPVLFHMNKISYLGSTALYDPTENDKSWNKAVEYIPEGKAYTGQTPLVHGVEESARYILGSLVGHKNVSTDSFSYTSDEDGVSTYNGFIGANSCGPTTLVMLASGQANDTNYDSHIKQNIITETSDQASYCTDKDCNRDSVIAYLNSEHNVKTYTITPKQSTSKKLYKNLLSMSKEGGTGIPIMFDTTDELTAALTKVIEDVVTQGSSFVQAGVTVSQQNRLEHDNQLYYAQFEPSTNNIWRGNLKKYKFTSDAVRDQKNNEAVDLTTGLFKEESQSYWTDTDIIDGNNVNKGGAAEELESLFTVSGKTYTSQRNVYTDNGGSSGLLSNMTLEPADLGINGDGEIGEFTAEEAAVIVEEWMQGLQTDADDNYSVVKSMGDPLHSEPKLLRYKIGEDADGEAILKTVAIYGTNEGYIHAVNTSDATGTEEWSYIPGTLLNDMKDFYINAINNNPEDRIYGVDGEITIAHADTNFNLYVDDDEKVIMYVGFRRGGSSYYALDISNQTPSLLFDIHSTDTGFESMGQTWGEPTITNMKVGGEPKAVMLFSAGYDTNQDTAGTASSEDSVGNDIFAVDALTGNLLWKASNDAGLAADLKYGMVGKLDTFGFNPLGLAEHFYASDLGGQLFRFDIDNSGDNFSVTGKKIASLQGAGGAENNRRFYYGPSVGYFIEKDGTSYMSIAIGSGYRAHPLDKTVQDHVYLVRDEAIFSDEFPSVELGDLVNITNNFDSADIKAQIDAGKKGWYLELDKSIGEKAISEVTTTFGKVLVTTYIPEATKVDACTPVVGKGRLYAMNVSDGTPIADLDEDGTDEEHEDRYVGLITPGISPPAQVLYIPDHTSNEDGIAVLVGAQNIGSNVGPKGGVLVKNLPEGWDGVKRVNWKKVEQ